MRGIYKGWAPTLIGYSLQGCFKFGLYEVFRILYSQALGEVGPLVCVCVRVCVCVCVCVCVLVWRCRPNLAWPFSGTDVNARLCVCVHECKHRLYCKLMAALYVFYSLSLVCPNQEKTYLWRTSLYLAASASAEFFADIALAPWEALKVRIQTQPGWANTLREGFPKLLKEEGWWG